LLAAAIGAWAIARSGGCNTAVAHVPLHSQTSDPGTPQAVAEMNAASEAMEDGQAAMAEGQYAEALRYFNIAVQVYACAATVHPLWPLEPCM